MGKRGVIIRHKSEALTEIPILSLPRVMDFLTLVIGGPELVIILMLLVIPAVWLYSLVHCVRNKKLSDTNRIIGIILILLLTIVGSLIYLFLPRENTDSVN